MRFLKDLSPRHIGLAAAVITVSIWAAFIVIGRASTQNLLTPLDIGLTRVIGASLVMLPLGWLLTQRDRATHTGAQSSFGGLSPLSWRITASCGLFGGFLYALLAYAGFVYAPAAHASVLLPGSLPLWTTLLALLVLGTRITPARVIGLACIVGGDLLVGGASLLQAFQGGEVWKGDLLFMAASICWACYSVLTRQFGLEAVRATTAITVFAFFSYVPCFFLLQALGAFESRLASVSWQVLVFQGLFQGLGAVVISGITFVRMIAYYGPVRSTMITALVPGLSALGAVVFLNEPLHWNLLAGLVLVTAGITFGVRKSA